MNEKDRLDVLKEILFTDDREYTEKIEQRLEQIEKTVNTPERLATKVGPIVADEIKEFEKNLPSTITTALKEEIKNHQDDVVDALFPILGKMVKKYVAQEMRLLTEKVNHQLAFKSPFSNLKRKIGSWFGGVKEEELVLSQLSDFKVEQVLLIEKGSGILAASYSETATIDEEMVSGMLTAIKTFVEDAFEQKNQELELIEYELYQIHLQSFRAYYVAVVVSGDYNMAARDRIQDIIFNFYSDYISMDKNEQLNKESVQKKIALNFENADL